jgi:hypothetical protein
MLGQMVYRARQFWHALQASPEQAELEQARRILTDAQMALFSRLQPSEQAHGVRVLQKVQLTEYSAGRASHPDLLAATLLHDVGKTRYPLQLWERVFIVLGKALLPGFAHRWGEPGGPDWQKPFEVARQHADWGARLVEAAGGTALLVSLIRRHQDRLPVQSASFEEQLLAILQSADSDS